MNCLFSGAIARIGGAQKRAGGVDSAKYSPGLKQNSALFLWNGGAVHVFQ